MKLSRKKLAAIVVVVGLSGALLSIQSVHAKAGWGARTTYYSSGNYQQEVGNRVNDLGCGGTITTSGIVTPYARTSVYQCQ